MRAGIKGKHSPSPNTYIYIYKSIWYRINWDATGYGTRPTESEIYWVNAKGRIEQIAPWERNTVYTLLKDITRINTMCASFRKKTSRKEVIGIS